MHKSPKEQTRVEGKDLMDIVQTATKTKRTRGRRVEMESEGKD